MPASHGICNIKFIENSKNIYLNRRNSYNVFKNSAKIDIQEPSKSIVVVILWIVRFELRCTYICMSLFSWELIVKRIILQLFTKSLLRNSRLNFIHVDGFILEVRIFSSTLPVIRSYIVAKSIFKIKASYCNCCLQYTDPNNFFSFDNLSAI